MEKKAKNKVTPLKAIRLKCLDCSCWQPKEVRLCVHEECSLFPYRFGKNPKRKGVGIVGSDFKKNNDLSGGKSQKNGIVEEEVQEVDQVSQERKYG